MTRGGAAHRAARRPHPLPWLNPRASAPSRAGANVCDKCNVAQSLGGCKCDSSCNCLAGTCGEGGDAARAQVCNGLSGSASILRPHVPCHLTLPRLTLRTCRPVQARLHAPLATSLAPTRLAPRAASTRTSAPPTARGASRTTSVTACPRSPSGTACSASVSAKGCSWGAGASRVLPDVCCISGIRALGCSSACTQGAPLLRAASSTPAAFVNGFYFLEWQRGTWPDASAFNMGA